jgi:enamine deaminase RidA (YjgF/YER057c/UK114 family)
MDFQRIDHPSSPATVCVSRFRGAGGVEEYHLMVRPTEVGSIERALEWIGRAYRMAIAELGIAEDTAVFRRVFCSDLPNQTGALEACRFASREPAAGSCAVSWVSQPPVPTGKAALWAYHVHDPAGSLSVSRRNGTLILDRGELRHQWSTGITSPDGRTAFDQTREVFRRYDAMLKAEDLSVSEHVLRTWLFVQNIDSDYTAMVAARREFFADIGMTPETHFVASSGIGGASARTEIKVSMDAYAIAGVRPEQIRYLEALDHLGPTHAYGVTFERATSVAYRDRVHVILSGTASIDPEGEIVFPGDVSRQLDRTLDNMAALLDQAGASLADMGAFIVYVRDAGDHDLAWNRMRERFGDAPIQVVRAPVCRPGWLIEVEGTAAIPGANPALPPF